MLWEKRRVRLRMALAFSRCKVTPRFWYNCLRITDLGSPEVNALALASSEKIFCSAGPICYGNGLISPGIWAYSPVIGLIVQVLDL